MRRERPREGYYCRPHKQGPCLNFSTGHWRSLQQAYMSIFTIREAAWSTCGSWDEEGGTFQETQGIPNPPCSKKKWSWPQIAASSFVTRRLDPRFSMAIKLMQMIMTARAPIKRFYSRHNERKQDGNFPNGLRGLIFYRPRPRRPVYISLLVYNKNF